MAESLFSAHWYRVSDLKPQLSKHVQIHRHAYRGLIWYVLEDKASARNHRFNSMAYQFIGLLDGKLTVKQIWHLGNERLGEQAPNQDQIIQLLGKLDNAELLQSGIATHNENLFERGQKHQSQRLKQRFGSLLAIKIPLWDPDAFLQRHVGKLSWLFHRPIGLIWLLTIGMAGLLSLLNWQEIRSFSAANLFAPYNLAIMVMLYPALKLLHELGHGFAAKHLGCQVHELGVSFLLFMPIPYVDVSSVTILRSKHQRMLVSAAGIMVELLLSALGLFIWLNVEPGLLKELAFNSMLIGGVSSLLFNGNPLLKYDGYYILADAIEIPNLYQRSGQYLIYLCQKYLFALSTATSPATAPGEARWFVVFSICALAYRMCLLWVIAIYLMKVFFVLGGLLAIGMFIQQILWPVFKGFVFVFSNPALQKNRFKALTVIGSALAILLMLVCLLPIPSFTCSEGVVWMPEDAQIRSETDGFAGSVLVKLPAVVTKPTPIIEINDPLLATEVDVLTSRLKGLNTQFRSAWANDRVKADNIMEEMHILAGQIKQAQKNLQAMRVSTKKAGKLLIPEAEDLPGRFIHQGEIIGYVLDDALPTVRVVVSQADIGRIGQLVKNVEIRLVNRPGQIIPAKIIRRVPEASNSLPSQALASTHGGKIAPDANSTDKLRVKQKVFQIDLEFNSEDPNRLIGQRVYVRFRHAAEPLAQQWARSLRQIFLRLNNA